MVLIVLLALYAPMWFLPLTYKKTLFMDNIYYHIRCKDKIMKELLSEVNKLNDTVFREIIHKIPDESTKSDDTKSDYED